VTTDGRGRPLRVGQRWRRPDGDVEIVEAVDPQTVQTTRRYTAGPPGAVAAGAMSPTEFDGFVLIEDPIDPTWTVHVNVGNAFGVVDALERVGTVGSVSSTRPVPGGLGAGPVSVAVVAPNADAARAAVESVLPSRHDGISVERL
jgi:hypothetical protein